MSRQPPHPTDLDTPDTDSRQTRCQYCLELVTDDSTHRQSCDAVAQVTRVTVTGEFGLVVPEQSGYLWATKTDAFAVRQTAVQGTYIPIGTVSTRGDAAADVELPFELPAVERADADSSHELCALLRTAVWQSNDYDYGGVNLGEKLIAERLDGVYADDAETTQKKARTRAARLTAVWDEIDAALPFQYDRVAAPEGYPRTREGLRWISVTGHNHPAAVDSDVESLWFKKPWVDSLIDSGPVALYYPNSD